MSNSVNPQDIPEVAQYEHMKEVLNNFKNDPNNARVIGTYADIVESYNSAREAAEKAVRTARVKCGDFNLYQQVEKTDGEKVLNAVGREAFIRMGGSLKVKYEPKISVRQLKVALAKQEISQELYDEVVRVEDRYHVPPAGKVI